MYRDHRVVHGCRNGRNDSSNLFVQRSGGCHYHGSSRCGLNCLCCRIVIPLITPSKYLPPSTCTNIFLGAIIRSSLDNEQTSTHGKALSDLTSRASNIVGLLNEEDDLTFLRIRSKQREIMVGQHHIISVANNFLSVSLHSCASFNYCYSTIIVICVVLDFSGQRFSISRNSESESAVIISYANNSFSTIINGCYFTTSLKINTCILFNYRNSSIFR